MTDEEMETELHAMNTMMFGERKTTPGYLVETKTGITGRTFHSEHLVYGKLIVHTEKARLLCYPETVTIKGFID